MKLHIQNLAIEVTRRCNIQCSHCLRGAAQNANIKNEFINALLGQVSSIGHIAFTGGEPSMHIDAIRHTINTCKQQGISINTFYIPTNGIGIRNEFVDVCIELYDYCLVKSGCHLQISNDKYHLLEKKYDDTLLKELPFFSMRHWNDFDNLRNGERMHWEGLAKKNHPEAKVFSAARSIWTPTDFDKTTIYLNTEGNIINGCDWSYSNQSKYLLCEVKDLHVYHEALFYGQRYEIYSLKQKALDNTKQKKLFHIF